MKAMIIGAAGFVGGYLADAIRQDLLCEVVVTKLPHEQLSRTDLDVKNLDILNPIAIFELLKEERPDYIFHLAAQSSIGYSWKNPSLTVDVNVKGSLNVLNAIRQLDYSPRVLVIGSGEEYGHIKPGHVPIPETEFLDPGNIYAATKVCQNMMATIYSQAYGLQLIMVRAFNHVGPHQAEIFVVSDFCKQVVMIEKGLQEPVMRVGNLAAKRDFTDVRDVVHAYTRLVQFGVPGETYNVGSGHAVAIQEILDTIVAQSDAKITVETDPAKLRPVDVPIIEADTHKIYDATGWVPRIPLAQTIADTLDAWRAVL
ncbi:MAG: GDP-mannose 4,6-dehydratase [Gemmiger sp.]|nr:GDP-mannose 4,6-dehydratase [Gemmiger sp.]